MSVGWEKWIGRTQTGNARILASAAQAMAATLDLEWAPRAGEPLPPGWQWLFFNPTVARHELGVDGHPRRGGFLPDIELPRRMWAGSRIRYLATLPIDSQATRTSRIANIETKTGKRGTLVFVTVEHTIASDGAPCSVEEQDIVYRDAAPPSSGAAPLPQRYDAVPQWSVDVQPDTTLLFRYSALTFNGHRIHYDQAYAREQEGYPDLVVHGPLTATLLQQFAVQHAAGRALARFEFRAVTPLFVDRAFTLEGRQEAEGSVALWARGPDGELAMSATAAFR